MNATDARALAMKAVPWYDDKGKTIDDLVYHHASLGHRRCLVPCMSWESSEFMSVATGKGFIAEAHACGVVLSWT